MPYNFDSTELLLLLSLLLLLLLLCDLYSTRLKNVRVHENLRAHVATIVIISLSKHETIKLVTI